MLAIEWTASQGWLAPCITPYQNLSLDPATCVFHYAFECFEGMKAYKDSSNNIRLFRPDKNMARFNSSSARIALPTFDGPSLISLISSFVKLEERFIPSTRGYSLYLRPTMIGTQRTLGVGPPGSALLYVIASPVGPYYPTGFKAVSLEATDYAVRAWPGGVGDKKLGANYAWGGQKGLDFTPGKDDSLYLYLDGSLGVPTTPITLKAHVGRTKGSLGLANPNTADDTYYDYSATAEAVGGPIKLGVSYVDTDITTRRLPGIGSFGKKLGRSSTVLGYVGFSF